MRQVQLDANELAVGRPRPADCSTFEDLYRRQLYSVFRYVLTFGFSGRDAEDLTHEIFLRAFEAFPRYEDRGLPVIAWLMRIARNAVTDAHRQRKPTLRWDQIPESKLPTEESLAEAETMLQDTLDELRALICQLPREKQELLALRFAGGLSVAEISRVLDMSEAAVRKQLSRTVVGVRRRYDALQV